jgi:hypothetical protein
MQSKAPDKRESAIEKLHTGGESKNHAYEIQHKTSTRSGCSTSIPHAGKLPYLSSFSYSPLIPLLPP